MARKLNQWRESNICITGLFKDFQIKAHKNVSLVCELQFHFFRVRT